MLVAANMYAHAQNVNIIPKPNNIKMGNGNFSINENVKLILLEKNTEKEAAFLNDYLKKYYGFALKVESHINKKNVLGNSWKNAIVLNLNAINNTTEGAYSLVVDADKIYISGNSNVGVFYGIQSLIQLLPTASATALSIPFVEIADAPRFAYRGMHLDVGRHFFDVEFVKRYIDFIALHKMNIFHWHLTEDQGWRIEIKKYPKLTQVGAYRNGTIIGNYPGTGNDNAKYGGYYTQKEIKEIVQYAANRHITIIPEIEMPGHSSAAIAAYPQLSCFPAEATARAKRTTWSGDSTGKQVQQAWGVFDDVFCPSEYTFHFLEDVLNEVMELFPSKYIHIGGDECPKANWKRSEFCQKLIKEKDLKDEHGLQSYFIQRIEKYLNAKGRQIIGWDEILEGGLAPNATVMSWRGEGGGIAAAKQKHQVIMTPGDWCYFDHNQTKNKDSITIGGYTSVAKVYSYEPQSSKLSPEEAKYVIGAQGNVWTEYMQYTTKVEFMIFPRISALSEVLWSKKDDRNWDDFQGRLKEQFKRYDLWKVHYNPIYIEQSDSK